MDSLSTLTIIVSQENTGAIFTSIEKDVENSSTVIMAILATVYKKDFYSFFSRNAFENGLVNRHILQSNSSNVCGLYYLFYLIRRFKGVSMKNIVNSSSVSDFSLNDLLIYEHVINTFPICVKNECVFNQKCESLIFKPAW